MRAAQAGKIQAERFEKRIASQKSDMSSKIIRTLRKEAQRAGRLEEFDKEQERKAALEATYGAGSGEARDKNNDWLTNLVKVVRQQNCPRREEADEQQASYCAEGETPGATLSKMNKSGAGNVEADEVNIAVRKARKEAVASTRAEREAAELTCQ